MMTCAASTSSSRSITRIRSRGAAVTQVYLDREPLAQVVRDFRDRQLTPGSPVAASDVPPAGREYAVTIADLGDFAADRYVGDLDRWARATLDRIGLRIRSAIRSS